jgi:hypothetical protein
VLTVRILAGFFLLLLGRRLFWLFVAALGFLFGMDLGRELLLGQPYMVVFVIAVLLGFGGALLAYFVQEVAIVVGGFLAGGYIAVAFVSAETGQLGHPFSAAFLVGGLLGAILLYALFDWALIVISSLLGADLVADSLHLHSGFGLAVFLALAVLGMSVQAGSMGPPVRRRRR